ncbi:hypothetical protein DACRYDRAFT_92431 [Dacryopinax primogenitus]|uniref:Uncharacterized protein n=1 Tax=Dacryopinax primogenitus (strain DJM 731) TaxID=1858805 RepID=M5GBR1_DACPD|nr:uncharacterized protein DACRYDRAFT_92431 [Dacryopinax primogenitus]EJU06424.1 hypothetical protein DACRYDRAFT_92431 [Dacryopinax primogenitus]
MFIPEWSYLVSTCSWGMIASRCALLPCIRTSMADMAIGNPVYERRAPAWIGLQLLRIAVERTTRAKAEWDNIPSDLQRKILDVFTPALPMFLSVPPSEEDEMRLLPVPSVE